MKITLTAHSENPGNGSSPADGAGSPSWEPVQRRGLLGKLSKGGMVMVAGLAGMLAASEPAAADCLGSPCCQLASCDQCSGGCNYSCPSGYYRMYWWCQAGARTIGCGECTTSSSNCWAGIYHCSVWWDDATC
jgi:hypothetical protein